MCYCFCFLRLKVCKSWPTTCAKSTVTKTSGSGWPLINCEVVRHPGFSIESRRFTSQFHSVQIYTTWHCTKTVGFVCRQRIFGTGSAVRDQYWRTDDGPSPARDETSVAVHFRPGGRARLQLTAQEGLLPSFRPLWSLQTAAGQRTPAFSKEKVRRRPRGLSFPCYSSFVKHLPPSLNAYTVAMVMTLEDAVVEKHEETDFGAHYDEVYFRLLLRIGDVVIEKCANIRHRLWLLWRKKQVLQFRSDGQEEIDCSGHVRSWNDRQHAAAEFGLRIEHEAERERRWAESVRFAAGPRADGQRKCFDDGNESLVGQLIGNDGSRLGRHQQQCGHHTIRRKWRDLQQRS